VYTKRLFLWIMYGLCFGFLVFGYILAFKDWSWVAKLDDALYLLVTRSVTDPETKKTTRELYDVVKILFNSVLSFVCGGICTYLWFGTKNPDRKARFKKMKTSSSYKAWEIKVAPVLFDVFALAIVAGFGLSALSWLSGSFAALQIFHRSVLQYVCWSMATLALNHFLRKGPR